MGILGLNAHRAVFWAGWAWWSVLMLSWTPVVPAAEILLDAESPEGMAAWSRQDTTTGDGKAYLPIAGSASVRREVQALQPDKSEGETLRLHPVSTADWRPYDRFVMDVLNDSSVPLQMRVQMSSENNRARRHFTLSPGRWSRMVLNTRNLDPQLVDWSRIVEVQLRFYKTKVPVELYMDNMMLLKPGEALPGLSEAFRLEMVRRLQKESEALLQRFAATRRSWSEKQLQRLATWTSASALNDIVAIQKLLNAQETSLDELASLGDRIDRAEHSLGRIPSVIAFWEACKASGTQRQKDVLIGLATSMDKIFPRELPLDLAPAKAVTLSVARNEVESFQVAVLPLKTDLHGVRLTCGDLRSNEGHVLSRERIDCDLTGYVETREQIPEDLCFVGWWPDPILPSVGSLKIAAGDVQSFWVRVRVPKEQRPGRYRGAARLEGDGMHPVRIPLTVKVHSFEMPDVSPIPTAISFGPPVAPFSIMLEELAKSPSWEKLKFVWADFLADYYISYDHLYRPSPPDFEVLDHLNAQNHLGAFNLGYFGVNTTSDGHADPKDIQAMLAWAGDGYAKAKDRGLLDRAYIYGFDEVKPECYATVEETAAAIHKALPGLRTMTTATDYTYGKETCMQSIDIWVPHTRHYDPGLAEEARAKGKQVWWYIAVANRHPYANIFLEYPAIEPRLLMGAMTARYRPDGFLYYQVSLWQSQTPITTWPFTNWDPRSYRDAHGDGSWVCMREGGLPVPTIRLENYRDGLDDFAYVLLLEEAIRRKESRTVLSEKENAWLTDAKGALSVPDSLVASLTEFSLDPQVLYDWRERLATLIDTSGEQELIIDARE